MNFLSTEFVNFISIFEEWIKLKAWWNEWSFENFWKKNCFWTFIVWRWILKTFLQGNGNEKRAEKTFWIEMEKLKIWTKHFVKRVQVKTEWKEQENSLEYRLPRETWLAKRSKKVPQEIVSTLKFILHSTN